ncbi:hypothetical protein Nepgr_028271 [Nepenthes gracilis]|uniref:Integral membrane bound transporter domain-containing protein n=1 Tax=Nepenthes gracilis TaxID=150966 RepID=A0AAD3Y294_NEPGR|nr:hypothetical protein Nepgr_028271 [Nepenthes gracilis]
MKVVGRRTVVVWRRRLGAALRIAVAYAIVGCATLYGPREIQRQVTYPAFSYLTATLIVSEATLGDTLRGTWQAIVGTCLVMGPAMLSLWLVGPGRFTPDLAALAVALGAFGVALPESTSLMSKRIAFGELVIVYVGTVIQGAETDIVGHPLHVAVSTALGAVASILAMVLPFPHLAVTEVRKACKLYAENAEERLSLYTKAIVAEESSAALELAAEAKALEESAAKLLRTVKKYQDGMLWEMPRLRLRTPDFKHPDVRLQEVEVSMRGMEMALSSRSQNPKDAIDQQIKDELQTTAKQLASKIEKIKASLPFSTSKTHDQQPNDDTPEKKIILPLNICEIEQHLLLCFFFFCMNRFNDEESGARKPIPKEINEEDRYDFRRIFTSWLPSHRSLIFAIKCSLSLGLAVLLGLIYNRDRGYWSGLAIAISFTTRRQATFWGANARAQGTALGSIYGVVGYLICHKLSVLKLAFLLPWIVFTTFLRHSKMYGEAGSISAVVAALLILGRRGYGTATEFALSRTTETCIGLLCFVLVEVLLHPERAATLSKRQLSQCFGTIKEFMETAIALPSMEEEKATLETEIKELKKFIAEAKLEPNFWFTPFQGDSYTSLQKSISKMGDLSSFMASAVESLFQELRKSGDLWKDNQEQINVDIELFKAEICSSLEYLKEATSTARLPSSAKNRETASPSDLEMGKQQSNSKSSISSMDDEAMENITSTFLQHSRDVTEINRAEESAEVRNKVLISHGCIGFCMRRLVTETREVEKAVRELMMKERC